MAARDALVPQAVAEDGYAIVPDRMGLGSFSISMFEWLASHRIDEYWFRLLGSTLDTVQALPRLAARSDRWPRPEAVFYKGQGRQRIRAGGFAVDSERRRVRPSLQVHRGHANDSFPTPHRIKRAYMRYLGYMMYHVIAWFDPLSAAAASAQAHTTQNKTLLHTHLEAALEKHADQSTPPAPILSSSPAALHIQKLVLDYTRKNADEFHECAVPPTALGQEVWRR
ncbi:unnamed protein product [Clonostachys rosea f. rosea IK726]|uniref:Uncharacterized protein n=1 Tax=Clonostachys rosea f. rosea IK726 TaxID=1349383 RepID=A0ACA9URE5_BIOOC|nr:unnamed protein product [Clonostachys rosea f. rosea IK726]